ncbi:hypothetical protein CL615_04045 [archaeon]|jgi:hypothetical protein|nr:hypothetical protein [archaeon]MDP6547989.1 hypothetical protein [Candidatus Woesearchaeota archaeon]|tara:strand:+ start:57157 stop:57417 length:261 start_codon:yes stop_codon:yes gene_type:complete
MDKILIIIGLILGIGGIIFSILPPSAHTALLGQGQNMEANMDMENSMSDMGNEEEHGHHNHGVFMTYGLIVAIIGLAFIFAGWKIF